MPLRKRKIVHPFYVFFVGATRYKVVPTGPGRLYVFNTDEQSSSLLLFIHNIAVYDSIEHLGFFDFLGRDSQDVVR